MLNGRKSCRTPVVQHLAPARVQLVAPVNVATCKLGITSLRKRKKRGRRLSISRCCPWSCKPGVLAETAQRLRLHSTTGRPFTTALIIAAKMELRTASARGSDTNCRGSIVNQLSGRRTRPADPRRVSVKENFISVRPTETGQKYTLAAVLTLPYRLYYDRYTLFRRLLHLPRRPLAMFALRLRAPCMHSHQLSPHSLQRLRSWCPLCLLSSQAVGSSQPSKCRRRTTWKHS